MKSHLVIGASGQVGEHLMDVLRSRDVDCVGTSFSHPFDGLFQLDIRNLHDVRNLLSRVRPAVIHIPASLTNVDYCETHVEEGFAINVIGVKNIVQTVEEMGARIVYFSSDYIFDGVQGPYHEDAPANPICEYGRQKLAAEHVVALQARDHLIIRTTVVYSWERQGKNFVQRLITNLQNGQSMRVPDDQIGNPTYAPELAQAVVELVEQDLNGVFHVVGPERTSRFEFACEAAKCFGLDVHLLKPVTTSELGQKAARPLNAGMVTDKVMSYLKKPLSSYKDGLDRMVREKLA